MNKKNNCFNVSMSTFIEEVLLLDPGLILSQPEFGNKKKGAYTPGSYTIMKLFLKNSFSSSYFKNHISDERLIL